MENMAVCLSVRCSFFDFPTLLLLLPPTRFFGMCKIVVDKMDAMLENEHSIQHIQIFIARTDGFSINFVFQSFQRKMDGRTKTTTKPEKWKEKKEIQNRSFETNAKLDHNGTQLMINFSVFAYFSVHSFTNNNTALLETFSPFYNHYYVFRNKSMHMHICMSM